MKKSLILLSILLSMTVITTNCKKEKSKAKDSGAIAQKFAKYRISMKKAIDLKKYSSTLEKIEKIELLEEIPKGTIIQKNEKDATKDIKTKVEISKIKTSDGKIGFIDSKHLAEQPIVFIENTKVYSKNNKASKVITTIPKGNIGFVVEEKGSEWTKIYVGKINNKWITKHWVKKTSYVVDEDLAIVGRNYETVMKTIKKDPADLKDKELEEAKTSLKEISEDANGGIYTELAIIELDKINNESSTDAETEEEPIEDSSDSSTSSDSSSTTENDLPVE